MKARPLSLAAPLAASLAAVLLVTAVAPGAANAADAAAGERVFQRCIACHTVERGGRNKAGPNLWGIFGAPAAGRDIGYGKYSDALKASGIVWDADTLSAYLEDPRTSVPKTRMAFPGLRDARQRADLIAYLEQVTQ